MKRLLFSSFIIIMASCSQNKSSEVPDFNHVKLEESSPIKAEINAETSGNAVSEGKSLVEGADCLGCHKISGKLVGPSYEEIAQKYSEKDADLLAEKVIGGGTGNWGSVPMSAHPGMSPENAKKMVAYILSLKK